MPVNEYPYLPPACRQGRCNHEPNRCCSYRSRRCLSGECAHAQQNLSCGVYGPTVNSETSR
ncbi:hypothetical protein OIE75_40930 (plasmid) [Streptomyces sp. NBC_01723]|uniref:hypothetical protein n=1 Tax=Streptomyces sp. NBC_01723 TaxID=2975921 RepID=UPI002E3613DD|nr:hypothetical protein [Streptomyces sp. NBC_01723]